MTNNRSDDHNRDEIGDMHLLTSFSTPLRDDAFTLTNAEKMDRIEAHFSEIMQTLGLDMRDDSLKGTPKRVAKMFVEEIFSGINPDNAPSISCFDNSYKYNQMLVEKDITVYSTCEHHFLPIVGRAHVAYISNGTIIGLSKINRIVEHYAKRPQVQERLTMQIVHALQKAMQTDDVACVIEAKHLCVNSRGIGDTNSSTITAELGGRFKTDDATRREFLHYIGMNNSVV